jgi:hypothetical protein
MAFVFENLFNTLNHNYNGKDSNTGSSQEEDCSPNY